MTESEAIRRIKECRNTPSFQPWFYMNEALNMAITSLEEIQQYRAIGTVSEFRELKEINEKITEAVNGQLIAGKNNYKEVYECFHKIADIVQGRIDWSEGKE